MWFYLKYLYYKTLITLGFYDIEDDKENKEDKPILPKDDFPKDSKPTVPYTNGKKHWYNNGEHQKLLKEGTPIPEGYTKGGLHHKHKKKGK